MSSGTPGPVPLNWLEPELYRRRRNWRIRNPKYLSEEEVTALAVPPPRVPPRRLEKQVMGFATIPVAVLLIALAGIGFGCVLLVLLGWASFGSPVEGALPVTLITAVGLGIGALGTLRQWQIKDRLLRRGVPVAGRITDVKRTGAWRSTGRRRGRRRSNDLAQAMEREPPAHIEAQYKATFEFTPPPSGGEAGVVVQGLDAARSCTATLTLWGQDGEIAERYLKDEARVTLLVDPENARRLLWLEVLRGAPL